MNNIPPQTRRAPAFTIMELTIVVVIIGVLAAIALPSYRIQMLKMKNQEAIRILMVVWEAQKEYYRENDFYAFASGQLPIDIPLPKYFYGLWVGTAPVSCTGSPQIAHASINSNPLVYKLYVLTDGRVVCFAAGGCSDPLCKKMGFKDDW